MEAVQESSNKLKSRGKISHESVDKLCAGLSAACALHCMAMPFLVGVLPVLGLGYFVSHDFEFAFVLVTAVLALGSLCWGYRSHKSQKVFVLLLISLLLLGGGLFVVSHDFHLGFVVAGALGVSLTHILNMQLCKSCQSCCNH
jgi:hypothetical protein